MMNRPLKITPGASRPFLPRGAVLFLIPTVLAVVCLLTVVVFATAHAGQRGREGGHVLDISHEIETVTQDLLIRIEEAQAGQRGYLLTGSPHSLLSYQQGRRLVQPDLERLQRLTSGDPVQQGHLQRLRPLIGAELAELQRAILIHTPGHPNAGRSAVSKDQSENLTEGIRAEMSRMQTVQSRAALSQVAAMDRGGRLTLLWVSGLIVLVGVLLTAALGSVVYLLRRQTVAEERISDYNTVLEFQKVQIALANAELERTNAELAALATTDGLTGLRNRRAFDDRLAEEFERASRYHTPLSLILLDIDHFKGYNDAFGHPAGDEVLRMIKRVLQRATRETDFLARYGGEEIAVLLPETDGDGAMQVAERVRSAIETAGWDRRQVTASFGVCTARLEMQRPEELVESADRALYRSKADGRNRVTHGHTLMLETFRDTDSVLARPPSL